MLFLDHSVFNLCQQPLLSIPILPFENCPLDRQLGLLSLALEELGSQPWPQETVGNYYSVEKLFGCL